MTDIYDELEARYDYPLTRWQRWTNPVRDWLTVRKYRGPVLEAPQKPIVVSRDDSCAPPDAFLGDHRGRA